MFRPIAISWTSPLYYRSSLLNRKVKEWEMVYRWCCWNSRTLGHKFQCALASHPWRQLMPHLSSYQIKHYGISNRLGFPHAFLFTSALASRAKLQTKLNFEHLRVNAPVYQIFRAITHKHTASGGWWIIKMNILAQELRWWMGLWVEKWIIHLSRTTAVLTL